MTQLRDLLNTAPFFEGFTSGDLDHLARHAQEVQVDAGVPIVLQGAEADRFYVLLSGRAQMRVHVDPSDRGGSPESEVVVRSIADPGRTIGWSALVAPHVYRATMVALEPTRLAAFRREWLAEWADRDPRFGVLLMKRALWVLGNRLREMRVRLVARRYEAEIVAIRALLAQSHDQLSVSSPLHKLPLYLEHRLTLSDAFHSLELLKVHGDETERYLASHCLDLLEQVRHELRVYQQLQEIYEAVVSSPADVPPDVVRRQCCDRFIGLFTQARYVIRGERHLPASPGHIFILNHLANHFEDRLPNRFWLTLDTHFVSAVLLYRKYGDAPIRVVRRSSPEEYAHRQYYERLDHIMVGSTRPDDQIDAQEADRLRAAFFEAGRAHLAAGRNLVICPEGASTTTEESPMRFRPGAFRLALATTPEPLIVPIVVANFDKKLSRTTLAVLVKPPFRLSERLPGAVDDQRLYDFLEALREQYRGWIAEAVALSGQPEAPEGPDA